MTKKRKPPARRLPSTRRKPISLSHEMARLGDPTRDEYAQLNDPRLSYEEYNQIRDAQERRLRDGLMRRIEELQAHLDKMEPRVRLILRWIETAPVSAREAALRNENQKLETEVARLTLALAKERER